MPAPELRVLAGLGRALAGPTVVLVNHRSEPLAMADHSVMRSASNPISGVDGCSRVDAGGVSVVIGHLMTKPFTDSSVSGRPHDRAVCWLPCPDGDSRSPGSAGLVLRQC